METLNTIYQIRSGNRRLTITKSESSVDIRITKFTQNGSTDEIEEELNIPIAMKTYTKLVDEMSQCC